MLPLTSSSVEAPSLPAAFRGAVDPKTLVAQCQGALRTQEFQKKTALPADPPFRLLDPLFTARQDLQLHL